MKANLMLGSLCLSPFALAAPLSRATILVAGNAIWQPAHQLPEPAILSKDHDAAQHVFAVSHPATLASEDTPTRTSDSERPKTTHELLELARQQLATVKNFVAAKSKPASSKSSSKVISVGALVDPNRGSVFAKLFDSEGSPYLIPGQYVTKQRADMLLVVGMILACALIVIVMESFELVASLATSIFRRERAIQLPTREGLDLEAACEDEDTDGEDYCDAPFGGYSHYTSLRLPEKLDEKAAWI